MGCRLSKEECEKADRELKIGFVIFCTVVTTLAAAIFCGSDAAVRSVVATPLIFGCMLYLADIIIPEEKTLNDLLITFAVLITASSSIVWYFVCGKNAAFRAAFVPLISVLALMGIFLIVAYSNKPGVDNRNANQNEYAVKDISSVYPMMF
jgi:hypothetical protein